LTYYNIFAKLTTDRRLAYGKGVDEMKYKIMFWLMCAFIYVCMFWVLPLAHDDSFSYLDVVFQMHVVVSLIFSFGWGFSYLAHKAFNL
jgi:hypothetical protein